LKGIRKVLVTASSAFFENGAERFYPDGRGFNEFRTLPVGIVFMGF
jgi:hypothetical protein